MTVKELSPLPADRYRELEYQMEDTPDPSETYTEWGAHPLLAELLRQFGYLVTSRYEAYEFGVKLLAIGPEGGDGVEREETLDDESMDFVRQYDARWSRPQLGIQRYRVPLRSRRTSGAVWIPPIWKI